MVSTKSLDELVLIAAMLRDVHNKRPEVFDSRALRLTLNQVTKRCAKEGISFLTKTLPRLGKAFDKALTGEHSIDAEQLAFKSKLNSKLPRFLGELFELVFSHDGKVLNTPCVDSIKHIRNLLYSFYKYKLPYTDDQEHDVLQAFLKAEEEIAHHHELFSQIADLIEGDISFSDSSLENVVDDTTETTKVKGESPKALSSVFPIASRNVIRNARALLTELFLHFDPLDIHPKHGPGSVSSKEKLWEKWSFANIPARIADLYPIDTYYYASTGHVCDSIREISLIGDKEVPARVILVPKDSRGPRLISCEPLENQYIQQGLGKAIVDHVERHHLTKGSVHFTEQQPNQYGALLGSLDGAYATLDLKEASDRVTVGLVRLLFPSKVLPYLLACRGSSTQLPDGRIIALRKYAPMGSALCFPVLALTIWAILAASTTGTDAAQLREERSRILVYGDDVIVPTARAANAIEQLESFGLKVNRDKSCVSGFFRESCGVDAYKGVRVTPLRFRNVWPSTPDPDSYSSWIALANQFYDRGYMCTYESIVERLYSLYGPIPEHALVQKRAPSLYAIPDNWQAPRKRLNKDLQKIEYLVRVVVPVTIEKRINGWKMLHRYFCEATDSRRTSSVVTPHSSHSRLGPEGAMTQITESSPFSVTSYTERRAIKLAWRWR